MRLSLPFREPAAAFQDILESIEKIERFTAGMNILAFSERDLVTLKSAVQSTLRSGNSA